MTFASSFLRPAHITRLPNGEAREDRDYITSQRIFTCFDAFWPNPRCLLVDLDRSPVRFAPPRAPWPTWSVCAPYLANVGRRSCSR